MARSPGFGCRHTYKFALFRLAFAVDPDLLFILHVCTNSQAHSSIGTASGFNALCHLVSVRFQELFHSPPGVLFTLPSRYSSTIGHQGVFRLDGWSRQIHAKFHESHATRGNPTPVPRLQLQDSHPLRYAFPDASPSRNISHWPILRQQNHKAPTTPHMQHLPA